MSEFQFICTKCNFECNSKKLLDIHTISRCSICHKEIDHKDTEGYAKKLCGLHKGMTK